MIHLRDSYTFTIHWSSLPSLLISQPNLPITLHTDRLTQRPLGTYNLFVQTSIHLPNFHPPIMTSKNPSTMLIFSQKPLKLPADILHTYLKRTLTVDISTVLLLPFLTTRVSFPDYNSIVVLYYSLIPFLLHLYYIKYPLFTNVFYTILKFMKDQN